MMGLTHFPNGVASYGIPVLPDTDIQLGKVWGDTYFVDTTNGSDSNAGTTPTTAFATIQAGIDACTTNQGDRIFVRDGSYTESLTIGKNRINLIGEGRGVTVTGSTNASPTLSVGGSNCTIANMTFAGVDTGVDFSTVAVYGDENRIIGCVFTANDGLDQLLLTGADETIVAGCYLPYAGQAGALTGAALSVDNCNNCVIQGNQFINGVGADDYAIQLTAAKPVFIIDNLGVGCSTASVPGAGAFIHVTSTSYGVIARNMAHTYADGIVEQSADALALFGYGAASVTGSNIGVMKLVGDDGFGNSFLNCTDAFDTSLE